MPSIHSFETEDFKRLADLLQIGKEVPDVVQRAILHRTIPDANFYKWLRNPRQRIIKFLGALLLVFSVLHIATIVTGDAGIAQCKKWEIVKLCAAFTDKAISCFEVLLLFPIVVYITIKAEGMRMQHA